jgi:hypothetical protein
LIDVRPGVWGAIGTLVLHLLGWYLADEPSPATLPAARFQRDSLVMVHWLPPDIPLEPPSPAALPIQTYADEAARRAIPSGLPPASIQTDAPSPPQPGIQTDDEPPLHDGVDSPALPVTEPDFGSALLLPTSGQPIHLRLYIAETGHVTHVTIVECDPQDEPFAAQVATILRQTPHVPARRSGQDVASVKDIWLKLDASPERRPLR